MAPLLWMGAKDFQAVNWINFIYFIHHARRLLEGVLNLLRVAAVALRLLLCGRKKDDRSIIKLNTPFFGFLNLATGDHTAHRAHKVHRDLSDAISPIATNYTPLAGCSV